MNQKQPVILRNGQWDGSIEKHAKVKLDHKFVIMLSRLRDS